MFQIKFLTWESSYRINCVGTRVAIFPFYLRHLTVLAQKHLMPSISSADPISLLTLVVLCAIFSYGLTVLEQFPQRDEASADFVWTYGICFSLFFLSQFFSETFPLQFSFPLRYIYIVLTVQKRTSQKAQVTISPVQRLNTAASSDREVTV